MKLSLCEANQLKGIKRMVQTHNARFRGQHHFRDGLVATIELLLTLLERADAEMAAKAGSADSTQAHAQGRAS